MDTLPTEIVTNILSFLDGKDLFRSKLLCLRFQILINGNREILQYPRFDLTVENRYSEETFFVHLATKWGFYVDFSQNDELLITPLTKEESRRYTPYYFVEDSEGQMSKFFGDFLKGNGQKLELQDILQYIFEKIEINEFSVMCLRIPKVFSVLNESIKKSCVSIREVCFTPYIYTGRIESNPFPELYDFLTTVANRKTNSKFYPRLKIGGFPQFIKHYWNRFVDFNEIALLFKQCIFEIDSNDAAYVMLFITDEFGKEPISRFNLCLSIGLRERIQFDIHGIEEHCDIEHPDGDFLLRCMDDEEAYVKLTHRQSKMALFFKKNGNNIVDRFSVKWACVSIDNDTMDKRRRTLFPSALQILSSYD